MAGVARVGDIVGKGGVLTAPYASSVTVNDRPIALFGCIFTPHPPCSPLQPQHCFGITLGLDNGVTVEGQIPLTGASIATCGDKVLTSSSDVIIAGGMLDLAVSLAAGGQGGVTGLESLAISSAGQIANGQNIGDVTKNAAVSYGTGQAVGAVGGQVNKVLK
jgi:hypothetical protein